MHRWLGRNAEAEENFGKTIARLNGFVADRVVGPRIRFELIIRHLQLAWTVRETGQKLEYESHIRRAVQVAEQLVADFPTGHREYRTRLVKARNYLVELLPAKEAE